MDHFVIYYKQYNNNTLIFTSFHTVLPFTSSHILRTTSKPADCVNLNVFLYILTFQKSQSVVI